MSEPRPVTEPEEPPELVRQRRRWLVAKLVAFPLRYANLLLWVVIAHHFLASQFTWLETLQRGLWRHVAVALAVNVVISLLWQCPRCRKRLFFGPRVLPMCEHPTRCPKCSFLLIH